MSYASEWIWAPVVMGVVVSLCGPSFALSGLAFVVLIAAGNVVALVGASVAAPHLLARDLLRRWLNGTSVAGQYLRARHLHRRSLSVIAARQALARTSGQPRGWALRTSTPPHGDEITVNWSVDPAEGLGAVLSAAGRTEQALLDVTPADPARVRAMLAAAGQRSATPDTAKAPVR